MASGRKLVTKAKYSEVINAVKVTVKILRISISMVTARHSERLTKDGKDIRRKVGICARRK